MTGTKNSEASIPEWARRYYGAQTGSSASPSNAVTTSDAPTPTNEKIVAIFAEIYRGIYPKMTPETRDALKEFVLKPANADGNATRSRAQEAHNLARRIINEHRACINDPLSENLSIDPMIGDIAEPTFTTAQNKIKTAISSDGPGKEAELLAKQLQLIPPIISLIANPAKLVRGFNNWANAATQVHVGGHHHH